MKNLLECDDMKYTLKYQNNVRVLYILTLDVFAVLIHSFTNSAGLISLYRYLFQALLGVLFWSLFMSIVYL